MSFQMFSFICVWFGNHGHLGDPSFVRPPPLVCVEPESDLQWVVHLHVPNHVLQNGGACSRVLGSSPQETQGQSTLQ